MKAGSFFTAEGTAPRVGQTLIAISPEGQSDYGVRVRTLLQEITDMPGARLPGARRQATRTKAEAQGLEVPAAFIQQARQLAGQA